MSNFLDFAETELRAAGLFDKDSDYGGMVGEAVMKLCRAHSEEGHSGFSSGMAISIFSKVARFEPLTPLTGADDEWTTLDFDGDMAAQNKRCPSVFKRGDGTAYDSNAVVFREPDGACFTSGKSRRDITFPYTPAVEYVDVPADREG